MNAIARPCDFQRCQSTPVQLRDTAKRAGILRRVFNAIMWARQRQAERDIARHFGHLGGHLTDETERQMMEHMMRNFSFRP
jgi:hypothetical protein